MFRHDAWEMTCWALSRGKPNEARGGSQYPWRPPHATHRTPAGGVDPDYSLSKQEWLAGETLDSVLERSVRTP